MPLEEYRKQVQAEKRAAALEGAIKIFLEQGYERTTLQQIAKAAGISTGTLFKYYPSKADLFAAIMQQMWKIDQDFDKSLPLTDHPDVGLFTIGMDYVRVIQHPRVIPLFRIMIAESLRFPELGPMLFEYGRTPYVQRTCAYLAAEREANMLCIDDISLAALQFLGMISHALFWPRLLLTDFAMSDQEIEHIVREAVKTLLARYRNPSYMADPK